MENPDTHSTLEVVPETDLPEVVPGVGKEVVPTPLPTSGTERKWSGLSEFLRKKKFLGAIIIFVIGASLVGGTVGGTWNREWVLLRRKSKPVHPELTKDQSNSTVRHALSQHLPCGHHTSARRTKSIFSGCFWIRPRSSIQSMVVPFQS